MHVPWYWLESLCSYIINYTQPRFSAAKQLTSYVGPRKVTYNLDTAASKTFPVLLPPIATLEIQYLWVKVQHNNPWELPLPGTVQPPTFDLRAHDPSKYTRVPLSADFHLESLLPNMTPEISDKWLHNYFRHIYNPQLIFDKPSTSVIGSVQQEKGAYYLNTDILNHSPSHPRLWKLSLKIHPQETPMNFLTRLALTIYWYMAFGLKRHLGPNSISARNKLTWSIYAQTRQDLHWLAIGFNNAFPPTPPSFRDKKKSQVKPGNVAETPFVSPHLSDANVMDHPDPDPYPLNRRSLNNLLYSMGIPVNATAKLDTGEIPLYHKLAKCSFEVVNSGEISRINVQGKPIPLKDMGTTPVNFTVLPDPNLDLIHLQSQTSDWHRVASELPWTHTYSSSFTNFNKHLLEKWAITQLWPSNAPTPKLQLLTLYRLWPLTFIQASAEFPGADLNNPAATSNLETWSNMLVASTELNTVFEGITYNLPTIHMPHDSQLSAYIENHYQWANTSPLTLNENSPLLSLFDSDTTTLRDKKDITQTAPADLATHPVVLERASQIFNDIWTNHRLLYTDLHSVTFHSSLSHMFTNPIAFGVPTRVLVTPGKILEYLGRMVSGPGPTLHFTPHNLQTNIQGLLKASNPLTYGEHGALLFARLSPGTSSCMVSPFPLGSCETETVFTLQQALFLRLLGFELEPWLLIEFRGKLNFSSILDTLKPLVTPRNVSFLHNLLSRAPSAFSHPSPPKYALRTSILGRYPAKIFDALSSLIKTRIGALPALNLPTPIYQLGPLFAHRIALPSALTSLSIKNLRWMRRPHPALTGLWVKIQHTIWPIELVNPFKIFNWIQARSNLEEGLFSKSRRSRGYDAWQWLFGRTSPHTWTQGFLDKQRIRNRLAIWAEFGGSSPQLDAGPLTHFVTFVKENLTLISRSKALNHFNNMSLTARKYPTTLKKTFAWFSADWGYRAVSPLIAFIDVIGRLIPPDNRNLFLRASMRISYKIAHWVILEHFTRLGLDPKYPDHPKLLQNKQATLLFGGLIPKHYLNNQTTLCGVEAEVYESGLYINASYYYLSKGKGQDKVFRWGQLPTQANQVLVKLGQNNIRLNFIEPPILQQKLNQGAQLLAHKFVPDNTNHGHDLYTFSYGNPHKPAEWVKDILVSDLSLMPAELASIWMSDILICRINKEINHQLAPVMGSGGDVEPSPIKSLQSLAWNAGAKLASQAISHAFNYDYEVVKPERETFGGHLIYGTEDEDEDEDEYEADTPPNKGTIPPTLYDKQIINWIRRGHRPNPLPTLATAEARRARVSQDYREAIKPRRGKNTNFHPLSSFTDAQHDFYDHRTSKEDFTYSYESLNPDTSGPAFDHQYINLRMLKPLVQYLEKHPEKVPMLEKYLSTRGKHKGWYSGLDKVARDNVDEYNELNYWSLFEPDAVDESESDDEPETQSDPKPAPFVDTVAYWMAQFDKRCEAEDKAKSEDEDEDKAKAEDKSQSEAEAEDKSQSEAEDQAKSDA